MAKLGAILVKELGLHVTLVIIQQFADFFSETSLESIIETLERP